MLGLDAGTPRRANPLAPGVATGPFTGGTGAFLGVRGLTLTGPAVTHASDFSLVTASKPATAGEILSLFATGLGPTRPAVDLGSPFPATPLAVVNSPVEVTVNGKPAEVLAAVGYPGAVDGSSDGCLDSRNLGEYSNPIEIPGPTLP